MLIRKFIKDNKLITTTSIFSEIKINDSNRSSFSLHYNFKCETFHEKPFSASKKVWDKKEKDEKSYHNHIYHRHGADTSRQFRVQYFNGVPSAKLLTHNSSQGACQHACRPGAFSDCINNKYFHVMRQDIQGIYLFTDFNY